MPWQVFRRSTRAAASSSVRANRLWLRIRRTTTVDVVETIHESMEIQLEQLDEGFWRSVLANALTGVFGKGRFRFTAKPSNSGSSTQEVPGAEFSMTLSTAADLSDDTADPEARLRLNELDAALVAAGWRRTPDLGFHWWSQRYERA